MNCNLSYSIRCVGIESADFVLSSMETKGGLLASFSDFLYIDLKFLPVHEPILHRGSENTQIPGSSCKFKQLCKGYMTHTWHLDNRACSSKIAELRGHGGSWRGRGKEFSTRTLRRFKRSAWSRVRPMLIEVATFDKNNISISRTMEHNSR